MASVSGLTQERFLKLRCAISGRMGSRRYSHTLGVEEAIIELGERYLPGEIPRLRVAALLHDITKEWTGEEQLAFCEKHNIPVTKEEIAVPKALHARTAAHVAAREFSAFVDDGILTAIERHTTGARGMNVMDELLYLADYIEPTRTYPDCIALRRAFYDGYEKASNKEEHLHRILLFALQTTAKDIEARGGLVLTNTNEAILYLSKKIEESY